MLTAERHQVILARLAQERKVVAAELSADLAVSQDTIRRDLRELAAAGLLRRVHGGALLPTTTPLEYRSREQQAPQGKTAIARRAARMIESGQVVILDAGTTAVEVARHLSPSLRGVRIVTNSLPVALTIADHPGAEISLIGGVVDRDLLATGGGVAVDGLRYVRADLCVLGTCSVHPDLGVSVLDPEDAHRKRLIVTGSAEVILVAAREKLGTSAPFVVCALAEITHLVTDAAPEDESLAAYRAEGVEITCA